MKSTHQHISAPVKWAFWASAAWVILMYLLNRSPFVGFNDGLSFLYEAETGFSLYTNATSHFLYNNFQHILVKTFFFVPPVLVLTLFSIVCTLGSLGRIMQIGKMYLGEGPGVLVLPLIMAFSFTFWQQTEIIEVYAFNNFIFLSFLLNALRDFKDQTFRRWLPTSTWMALGLLTHIQHILSLPFFLFYLLKASRISMIRSIAGISFVAAAFGILFLIPAMTGNHSFSAIFFDNHFQNDILGLDAKVLLRGSLMAAGFLVYNFHIFLIPVLWGWWKMWKQNRHVFWQIALLFVPYFGFAVKYSVTDNHVFFLISYFAFLIPIVFCVKDLNGWMAKRIKWAIPVLLLISPMIYAGTTIAVRKIEIMQTYDTEKAYKGGVTHLLWPGKCWAKDPLALARELQEKGVSEDSVEWNYPIALKLLELE